MILGRPFEVVTTSVEGSVLAALTRSEGWKTTAQVMEGAGRGSRQRVLDVLRRLASTGVVEMEQDGRQFRYRLNRDHLAAPALLEIGNIRHTLLRRLQEVLGEWCPAPVFAALFGSAARGDMRIDSDIDVFTVHLETVPEELVDALAAKVERWTGNRANFLSLTASEVRMGGRRDAIGSILDEGIPLLGKRSWLVQATVRKG